MAQSLYTFANGLAVSPLQQLQSPFLSKTDIKLFVKRDDLIHPQFGGNKWRKLKYNLFSATEGKFDSLLTFGGAWSNHIYATAAAGKHFGFSTIGIIRGEEHKPLNATLEFAQRCGMQLHYINRKQYRQKDEPSFQQSLKEQFGNVYLIPEGGSNSSAIRGCKEIVEEINAQIEQPYDIICCASGTGGTLAGIASALAEEKNEHRKSALGFSVLKNGDFLNTDVQTFLNNTAEKQSQTHNWQIETNFHFGGYAKINDELVNFMRDFQAQYDITLDAVYTAKMFYGLFELIKTGTFKAGSTIIAIHSGGLQGNKGFNL